MGSALANFAANKELKDRIIFTLMMFFIFRLGVHIPVPGVIHPFWRACSPQETFSDSLICFPAVL